MEKELFTLLRLGLGNTTSEEDNLLGFPTPSTAEWARLGKMAQKQGVLGIMLDGIDRLAGAGYGMTGDIPAQQKREWIGSVLLGYEARNKSQIRIIDDLQKKWAESGIKMMVMKGQAMGLYYPNPMHRAPGDIDCYLFDGYDKGNEAARKWADKVNEGWYKHSVISYKGETIENHQFFVHTREGQRSKLLNQLLCESLKDAEFDTLPGTGALLPPSMFNAIFLSYHALAHFLEEGLRLKQILDWAMFLKRDADKVDWKVFYSICDRFHFRRFAVVMTDIAVHYLGVKSDNIGISASSPYTERVLQSTFYDKDYVFSNGQSEWANRWHIVKNLFKYRWKYEEIYQQSVWKQLWWYISGFLLKTE